MKYKNRAHRSAYNAGKKAARDGRGLQPPYDATSRTSAYFRRAWLNGYRDELEHMHGRLEDSVCVIAAIPIQSQKEGGA